MRRFLCIILAATVIVLSQGPAVRACINDRDTYRIEREFRKNYEFKSGGYQDSEPISPSPEHWPEPKWTTVQRYAGSWAGMAMLVGTVGVVGLNFRRIGS